MGYNLYFRFIKDELINANDVFIQNVDNFLFSIYFGYLGNFPDNEDKKTLFLSFLFRNIKNVLMGGSMQLGYKKMSEEEKNKILKEIEEEKDEEKKKIKISPLDFKNNLYDLHPHEVEELVDIITNEEMRHSELKMALILYCILVNSLDKTEGEKFDKIKNELFPLIKLLKEIFCEFDHNEIHNERTFIFALRSPAGYHDVQYNINNGDDMLNKYDFDAGADVNIMDLYYYDDNLNEGRFSRKKNKKDKRIGERYDIVLNFYLCDLKNYYRL